MITLSVKVESKQAEHKRIQTFLHSAHSWERENQMLLKRHHPGQWETTETGAKNSAPQTSVLLAVQDACCTRCTKTRPYQVLHL